MVKVNLGLPWNDALIYYSDRTGSTMEDARELVDRDAPHGTVAMAGFQERGRGRFQERSWVSVPGANLLFTVILHKSRILHPLSVFPLLAGLSVALSLERQSKLAALVKWPNDVLVDGKKIAGILCEDYKDSVLAGIGINLNQAAFDGALGKTACSVRMLTRRHTNPFVFLGSLMYALNDALSNPGWLPLLSGRLFGRNQTLRLVLGNPGSGSRKEIEGTIEGINPDGALLFRDSAAGTLREIHSGELNIFD